MQYFTQTPNPDIKIDLKTPNNYTKCLVPDNINAYHRDINKFNYFMLKQGVTAQINPSDMKNITIYYCVNTLIVCTNDLNMGWVDGKQQSVSVRQTLSYMADRFPYFDKNNMDTWDKLNDIPELRTKNKLKTSSATGYFPIFENSPNGYKSKQYNFIIYTACGYLINYNNKNAVVSVSLYLKDNGYVIITVSCELVHSELVRDLTAIYDGKRYFKVIDPFKIVKLHNKDTRFTVLQKINISLSLTEITAAKQYCNWQD